MPRPRQPGRHRRPEPPAAPEGAPALVLAIPGTPTAEVGALVDEVVSIARSELPGLDIRAGYLERPQAEDGAQEAEGAAESGPDAFEFGLPVFNRRVEEFPTLIDQLAGLAHGDGSDGSDDGEEGRSRAPEAVVVPLLAGPEAGTFEQIRAAVDKSGVRAELTDALGPHPLLAEALHVRLSEAGLARADRARLFTVATAADGIILATTGGEEAVQAAGVTGLLLAARLAVPVMAAGLDVEGAIARTAESLRTSGSGRLALAPCVIGPELPAGLLADAARDAACDAAEPLGAYPAVGRLVLSKYMTLLGIAPQRPQNTPAR